MNEAKCCKCGKPAAVVDYVHGEERAYCAACLANQRSAEQGLPIDPEAVRLGKPTNAAEHIAALEAGTLTQWRAEGNALRETPTPEWPEIEKSIVWEEKELEDEPGAPEIFLVGQYARRGQDFALKFPLASGHEMAKRLVTMGLRIDYAFRIAGAREEGGFRD